MAGPQVLEPVPIASQSALEQEAEPDPELPGLRSCTPIEHAGVLSIESNLRSFNKFGFVFTEILKLFGL